MRGCRTSNPKERSADLHHPLPGEGRLREAEIEVPHVGKLLEALVAGQRLDARLHGARLGGLRPEPRDERLRLLPLLLVVSPGLLVDLLLLEDLPVELLRAAGHLPHPGAVDRHRVGRDAVHEIPVVGDHQERPPPAAQEAAQPPDGDDVQVVGRLVEQEEVGGGKEGPGEVEADLVAAGQGGGGRGKVVLGEAEPREDRLGPVRLVRAVLPRGERGGRLREHRRVVEPEMLREVPDPVPGGNGHRAGIGGFLPEQDPEQGGLPRPVASHHPHPLAGRHLERGPLEQGLPPVGFGEVGDGQHGSFQDSGGIDFPARDGTTGVATTDTLPGQRRHRFPCAQRWHKPGCRGTTRRKTESPPGPTPGGAPNVHGGVDGT